MINHKKTAKQPKPFEADGDDIRPKATVVKNVKTNSKQKRATDVFFANQKKCFLLLLLYS